MPSYNNYCLDTYKCKIYKKKLIISGGGQLLGNDDGVKISLGSGLPVGNSYK